MRLSEAISEFVQALRAGGNSNLDKWNLDLETQVLMSQDDGEIIKSDKGKYYQDDHGGKWWDVRIPKVIEGEHVFDDYNVPDSFMGHAWGLGCTGRNFADGLSVFSGFDFDSITGHAPGVGVSSEQLNKIKELVTGLPWVEVRRSSAGQGLHLFVYYGDYIKTSNRAEHAALSRAVLDLMSWECGFNLQINVDACGGNIWLWSRKANIENRGYELIKAATEKLTLDMLPSDWRSQVSKSTAVKIDFSNLGPSVPLDERHERTVEALRKLDYSCSWDAEHNLLRAHTGALATLITQPGGDFRGFFATNSPGSDRSTPNAFMFPCENGEWRVYRFSQGIVEHPSWTQDGQGWTWTYFDRPDDLETAAARIGATEVSRGQVAPLDVVAQIARAMGLQFEVPDIESRDVVLKQRPDGRLEAKMPVNKRDPDKLPGWHKSGRSWERMIGTKRSRPQNNDVVRCMSSESGSVIGFCRLTNHGTYDDVTKGDALSTLAAEGMSKAEADRELGRLVIDNCRLVNRPFSDEYPAPSRDNPKSKLWNRDAARLAYRPADHDGPHPHFDMILAHVGAGLTQAVQYDPWCRERGINDGAGYLLCWAASLLQFPYRLLPYLFFFGPQDSGKSSFYLALASLMTKGAAKIDAVFSRRSTFTSELAGTILGIVEEADLTGKHATHAYSTIKDLTTGAAVRIEKKYLDAYEQRNCLHVIQTANHPHHCPIIEEDDTRIIVAEVGPLAATINRDKMAEYLAAEATYFLRTLLHYDLPPLSDDDGRLYLPVLHTKAKDRVIAAVAKVTETPREKQAAASMAETLRPFLRSLAESGLTCQISATDLLDKLREIMGDHPSCPRMPEELTLCLSYLREIDDPEFVVENGKHKTRWWTVEVRRSPEQIIADIEREADLAA